MIVAVGGGSNIDACKAANALAAVGWKTPELDAYFGTGLVKQAILEVRRAPLPLFAVQTAASSAAHLTKYANVTDPATWQKKLIIDEAIVPPVAVFDYETTLSAPPSLTREGVLDTLAHTFESFCGAKGGSYALEEEIAVTAISLLAQYAPRLAQDPGDREAREAVGLASDLGGYAIMAGGTSRGASQQLFARGHRIARNGLRHSQPLLRRLLRLRHRAPAAHGRRHLRSARLFGSRPIRPRGAGALLCGCARHDGV